MNSLFLNSPSLAINALSSSTAAYFYYFSLSFTSFFKTPNYLVSGQLSSGKSVSGLSYIFLNDPFYSWVNNPTYPLTLNSFVLLNSQSNFYVQSFFASPQRTKTFWSSLTIIYTLYHLRAFILTTFSISFVRVTLPPIYFLSLANLNPNSIAKYVPGSTILKANPINPLSSFELILN